MRIDGLRLGASVLYVTIVAVAACDTALPAAIGNGFPLGEPVACETDACARYVLRARAWLDLAEPGHPAVVGAQAFVPAYRDQDGRPLVLAGDPLIVVLRLGDGSTRARHVACEPGADSTACWDLSLQEALTGLLKG